MTLSNLTTDAPSSSNSPRLDLRARVLGAGLAAGAMMLAADRAAAQCAFEFADAVDYAAGAGTVQVAVADLNGDGRLDVVAVNEDDDSVSVLLGNGDGTLGVAIRSAVGDRPVSIGAADFDGDGATDVAVASQDGAELLVMLGNGDGTFGAPVS